MGSENIQLSQPSYIHLNTSFPTKNIGSVFQFLPTGFSGIVFFPVMDKATAKCGTSLGEGGGGGGGGVSKAGSP